MPPTTAATDSGDFGTQDSSAASRGGDRSIASEIKEQGQKVADAAMRQAETVARKQQTAASEFLTDLCAAAERSADTLQEKGRTDTAAMVRSAIGEVGRFTSRLTEERPKDLLREAEAFARRNPALAAGAAALVGFAAVRFLKSSDPHSDTSGESQRQWAEGGGASFSGGDF